MDVFKVFILYYYYQSPYVYNILQHIILYFEILRMRLLMKYPHYKHYETKLSFKIQHKTSSSA